MSSRTTSQWHTTLSRMALLLILVAGPSYADKDRDHDRARQALEAGEVLPLRTILERVEREHPGQVMEVELDREKGEWLYEIKILREGGALVKLKINARDGSLLGIKEKHGKPQRAGDRR